MQAIGNEAIDPWFWASLQLHDVECDQKEHVPQQQRTTTGIQNFTSSESTIEDVDMASEVSTLTQNQILQQTAMAMLAQANAQPQSILKLLS